MTPTSTTHVRLTEDQFVALLAESAKPGASSRKLAAWLKETYQVEVSHAWVAKQLREHREERKEAIRAKVVEALAPHVVSDLELLATRRAEVGELCDTLLKAKNYPLYLKAVAAEVRILDRRLYYAGVGPDPSRETLADFFALSAGDVGAQSDALDAAADALRQAPSPSDDEP